MKTTIIAAAIVLFTTPVADATQYRGTFETVFMPIHFESRAVTATVNVTSDGAGFQFDSISVALVDTLPGLSGANSFRLMDPLSASLEYFWANTPVAFIAGTSLAPFTTMPFGPEISYAGIYKEPATSHFTIFDESHSSPVDEHSATLVVDFADAANSLTITFSDFPLAWDGHSVSTSGELFPFALDNPRGDRHDLCFRRTDFQHLLCARSIRASADSGTNEGRVGCSARPWTQRRAAQSDY